MAGGRLVGWLLRARQAGRAALVVSRPPRVGEGERGWVSLLLAERGRERKEVVVGREERSEFGVAGGPRGSTEEGEWRKKKIHSVPPTTNCRQKYNRGGDFEVGSVGRASRKERERKDLEFWAI